MSPTRCAAFLGVSLRTVRHWDAGRNRVPWSVVRILRLRRLGDLGALHDSWAGWMISERTGELVSPNGYTFQPRGLANWPGICEQARFWRDGYAQRAAGGVGALAPARPQAVPLQPEVWKAEVVTEALPSPPLEALAPLNLLLGLAGLARGAVQAIEATARPAAARRVSAGTATGGPALGEHLMHVLRQLATDPVADQDGHGVCSIPQGTPAGRVPPSPGTTSQSPLDPGFPKPDKQLGDPQEGCGRHLGRGVQRSRDADTPLLDPTPTPEIRPTRSAASLKAPSSAASLGRRTARARKPARKGGDA